jgi:hypothetical protein
MPTDFCRGIALINYNANTRFFETLGQTQSANAASHDQNMEWSIHYLQGGTIRNALGGWKSMWVVGVMTAARAS